MGTGLKEDTEADCHWNRGFIWILMPWKEHGGAPRRALRPLRQSGSPFLVVSYLAAEQAQHQLALQGRDV